MTSDSHISAAAAGILPRVAAYLDRLSAIFGKSEASAFNDNLGRVRPLSLDIGRLCALAAGLTCLALLASQMAAHWSYRSATNQTVTAALAFVDARLAEAEGEMARLADDSGVEAPLDACPAALTAALVRASITSPLVRRFHVTSIRGDFTCGPQGQGPAIDLPQGSMPALALTPRHEFGANLMFVRRLENGARMVAMLDPRIFAPMRDGTLAWMASEGIQVVLKTADGQPLLGINPASSMAPPVLSLHAMARSERYRIAIAGDVDGDALADATMQRLPGTLATALLAALMLAAWVWRRVVLRARLYHRLEYALRKRQFEPFVQPIVALEDGRCIGGEVLMRWNHPQRGIVGPGEFVEEAERTGLIVGMSDLVMARAAHRLAPIAQARPELYFSFNVTPTQLCHPGFAQRLAELFRPDTLPRGQVLLEITEREFVDPLAKSRLLDLRAAGWRIAIDDFGTGQSSLASIEELPIDRIKIDRAFVSTIDEATLSRPVLDTIIKLGHELGTGLIAEGVETRSQWEYLRARGVQSAQGYLFARPLSISAFGLWLADRPGPRASSAVEHPPMPARAETPRDTGLRELWDRMGSSGGLDIRDRLYRLRPYQRCFVGREAVDWLVREQRIERPAALRLGRRLAAYGWIGHVLDEHDFEDAELFYRLLPQSGEVAAQSSPAIDDMLLAMRGAEGPRMQDHCRGLVRHRACTTGRGMVDWIAATYRTPRSIAAQWARLLMQRGVLRHVFDDRPFQDDLGLYRLV